MPRDVWRKIRRCGYFIRFDVGVGDVTVIVRHPHVAANARITLTVDSSISPANVSV